MFGFLFLTLGAQDVERRMGHVLQSKILGLPKSSGRSCDQPRWQERSQKHGYRLCKWNQGTGWTDFLLLVGDTEMATVKKGKPELSKGSSCTGNLTMEVVSMKI